MHVALSSDARRTKLRNGRPALSAESPSKLKGAKLVEKTNAGKTRWINKTFAGIKCYCPRVGKYPFEGYADQDIIIYDDREGVKFEEFASVLNTWEINQPIAGEIRYITRNWKIGHTRSIIVLSNRTIEESMPQDDHTRMRKRFIQIINPVLIPPDELSSEGEDNAPAAASQAAAQEHAEFAS